MSSRYSRRRRQAGRTQVYDTTTQTWVLLAGTGLTESQANSLPSDSSSSSSSSSFSSGSSFGSDSGSSFGGGFGGGGGDMGGGGF